MKFVVIPIINLVIIWKIQNFTNQLFIIFHRVINLNFKFIKDIIPKSFVNYFTSLLNSNIITNFLKFDPRIIIFHLLNFYFPFLNLIIIQKFLLFL